MSLIHTKTKTGLSRIHWVRGTRVRYVGPQKNAIWPPRPNELGIIEEEYYGSFAVQWDHHGWCAWFSPKDLAFVSKRSLKWLDILDKVDEDEE